MLEENKELVKELEKYIQHERSEVQELLDTLISSLNSQDYMLNEDLYKNIILELKNQLQNYKDYCDIVEEEKTEKKIVKYLKWE